jgi:hypothetical protein
MENRFEYRMNNILLTNGIFFLITGVLFATSKGMQNWQPYVWWAGSVIWTYRYFSYRKHGFLRVDSSAIQINHANWKGLEKINKTEISKIDFTPKAFVVYLESGKKIKIHRGNLVKELSPDLEEVLNTEYEKQTCHNKT